MKTTETLSFISHRRPPLPLVIATLPFLAAAASAIAQDAPPAPPPGPVDLSLFDLYMQGGPLMHVIALCSIGVIAVAAFCAVKINKKKLIPLTMVHELNGLMAARDLQGAYAVCENNPSVLCKAVAAAILKADYNEPKFNRAEMEKAAAEKIIHEETRLNLWINYLNVFATIAPMLGLLGTVTGMIQAFSALAAGLSEPSDLAGGIGEAMLTTAGGLFVGIPAMFLYFFFRNILQGTVADIEAAIVAMLDGFVSGHSAEVSQQSASSSPSGDPAAEPA